MDVVTAPKLEPGMAGGPTKIGRYKILQVVGRGAYGRVFACYDPVLDRRVAVKVTAADVPDGIREEQLQRFKIEAQVLGRLQHPNIVAVYDAGVDDDRPYLAMELCSGPSLEHVLQRSRLSLREIAAVTAQMGSALDYIHAQDILHRDIKPANVLLHEGRIKLTDFGLARTGGMGRLTQAGQVMGTPSFMAPEQVRGEKLDRRSDLYALGVLMFNMRAGRPPFIGDPLLVMSQLASRPAPLLSTLVDDTPEVLDEFFARALAMEPGERFSSGTQLCRALARVMQIIEGGNVQGPTGPTWAGGGGTEEHFGLEGAAPAARGAAMAAGMPGGMAGGSPAGGMDGGQGAMPMPGAYAGDPAGHGLEPMAVSPDQLMGMVMAGGQGQAAADGQLHAMAGRVMARPPWESSSGGLVAGVASLASQSDGSHEASNGAAQAAGAFQTLRASAATRDGTGVLSRLSGMVRWHRVNLLVTLAILFTAALWTVGIARVSYRASNASFRGPRFLRGATAPLVQSAAAGGLEAAQAAPEGAVQANAGDAGSGGERAAGENPAGVPGSNAAGGVQGSNAAGGVPGSNAASGVPGSSVSGSTVAGGGVSGSTVASSDAAGGGVSGSTNPGSRTTANSAQGGRGSLPAGPARSGAETVAEGGARAAGAARAGGKGIEGASAASRHATADSGRAGQLTGKTRLEGSGPMEKSATSGARQSKLATARTAAVAPIASGATGSHGATEGTGGRTDSSFSAGSAPATPQAAAVPQLRLRPSGGAVADQKLRLEAEMVPLRAGFEVQCQYRQDGRWFLGLVRELGGGRYAVDVLPRAGRLDYRFELVDAYGARRGSAAQAIEVQPAVSNGQM